jgi:hypothetical protein
MSLNSHIPTKASLSEAFNLGHFYMSKGVSDLLSSVELDISKYMNRHVFGDWSDMADFDRTANIEAIELGGHIFSAFKLPQECLDYIKEKQGELISDKIYLDTNPDRTSTTMRLPFEELVH